MKLFLLLSFVCVATVAVIAAPFAPIQADEPYGVGCSTWRFTSSLSREAYGVIEICYAEKGSATRILGQVTVRPFTSSNAKMPDLRILFTRTEIEGKKQVVMLVAYGIRSGVFVVDVPGLTKHSLFVDGTPQANSSGEFTLLSAIEETGTEWTQGRLFFRYVE